MAISSGIRLVGSGLELCLSPVTHVRRGNESQAVVEFAPYQKVPSDRKKQDARAGTIDKGSTILAILFSWMRTHQTQMRTSSHS
jgi:hypothetical protein